MITIIYICIYLMIGFALDYLIDAITPEMRMDSADNAILIILWLPIVIVALIEMLTNRKGE